MWSKFKKFFSSMKIKHKVRFLFLAVLAVYVVALFLIFTFVLRKQVYQYALENNKKSMMSIGSNLTTEIEKVNNYSRLGVRTLSWTIKRPALDVFYNLMGSFLQATF